MRTRIARSWPYGLLLLVAGILVAGAGLAQQAADPRATTAATYNIAWWTVDSGGDLVSGGGYALKGTVGQPDAGPPFGGGAYTLSGGFWSMGPAVYAVHLPLLRR